MKFPEGYHEPKPDLAALINREFRKAMLRVRISRTWDVIKSLAFPIAWTALAIYMGYSMARL